jgi:hypothetical protein
VRIAKKLTSNTRVVEEERQISRMILSFVHLKCEWIAIVDADERLTPELKMRLQKEPLQIPQRIEAAHLSNEHEFGASCIQCKEKRYRNPA